MGPVNRQEVQIMLDNSRNQLLQRTAAKQDVQAINDTLKTLLNVHQQNQQFLRQAEYQRSQLTRRVIALETRLAQLEQELRTHRDLLSRIASQQTQQPQVVVTQPPPQSQDAYAGQYVYRPA